MKISPINNAQPSCKARFSHAEVQKLIDSTKNMPSKQAMPQLYTLLEYVFVLPNTKKAKLVEDITHKYIEIDGVVYGKAPVSQTFFDALKNACVACAKLNQNGEALQPYNHIYMSEAKFNQRSEFFKNVTKDGVHTWGWM